MSDITKQAKTEFYKNENCSCVILDTDNKVIFKSYDKGIKPLIDAIHLMKDTVVADKIIGKAAALLCVYGGAKAVYGHTMSVGAQTILDEHNIICDSFQVAENIINRQGTDICPMEKLVMQTNSPSKAFQLIFDKVGGMNNAI